MGLNDSYGQGGVQYVSGYSPKLINYSDATYDYICLAKPGTAASVSKWRIIRVHKTTGDIMHASGYENFSDPATSSGVVAALSYS